ncbi:phthiocerol/phthiodiolone dimycocerosyl transferase family protein [Chryseobacterium herbae]|uniref:Phthiocerol/phthiodiolone dimycocerosyl transferase n=1 Tax=Chryseobacterium herbae TaxID=2976476 RepID=A0ABT2ISW8_9FLAO|nr:condensation domain-containing protein [Chryseobacterium sp. pc1-10]MCT2561918.1 condensation domain-containing protein [Chryseobacterium sp. pc1-10]
MIRRNLMMVERIMYVDPETPVNCLFTTKIKGNIPEENFKTALEKIQQKHPLLRTRIDNSSEKYPFFIEEKEIEPIPLRIVERKTDDDWLQESETEWKRIFKDPKKPLAQLVWIKGNDVSEILWVLPHCICDGTSLINLMKELLGLLDDPSFEMDPYYLFSSVDDFLPLDFNMKKQKRKARFYLMMGRLFFLMQRKSKIRNLGSNYVVHWKLNSATTAQITEKSKAHGVSVHALLCSSFMQAFQEIQGKQAKGKVISPVDVRHFIPEIRQDHVFAFAPTVELSLKKGSTDVLENARQIKKDLVEKIEKMEARELLWMGEQMHPVAERMVSMMKSSKGGHDVTLSNMGRINIPSDYKNFKVETVFSPTVAFPWLNSNTLVATTYNQQMDFTLMSNEHFLPKEEAVKIKDKAIELLISSL